MALRKDEFNEREKRRRVKGDGSYLLGMKSGIPEIYLNVVKLPARLNSFGGGCSNFHQILNKPHLSSSLRVI